MIKKLTIKKFLEQKLSTKEVWNEMRKLHEENKHLNILLQDYFEKTPTEGTIPISIKDNIHIAGQVTTSGSRIMKNFVAPFLKNKTSPPLQETGYAFCLSVV